MDYLIQHGYLQDAVKLLPLRQTAAACAKQYKRSNLFVSVFFAITNLADPLGVSAVQGRKVQL